jgi:hypothetical protein
LLHTQTRRLQAIACLPQGYEGTERNHNPRVGGSSPSSATRPSARLHGGLFSKIPSAAKPSMLKHGEPIVPFSKKVNCNDFTYLYHLFDVIV